MWIWSWAEGKIKLGLSARQIGVLCGLLVSVIALALGFAISETLPDRSIDGTVNAPYSYDVIGSIDSSKMEVCVSADKPTAAYLLTPDAFDQWQRNGGSPAMWGNVTAPLQISNCSAPASPSVYYLVLVPLTQNSGYHFSETVIYYPYRDWWQIMFGVGGGILGTEVVEALGDKYGQKNTNQRK